MRHPSTLYLSLQDDGNGTPAVVPAGRRVAALCFAVLLLIAVWPANLQMVLAARAAEKPFFWHQALLWLRLPLQLVLMMWVWRASRSRREST